MNCCLRRLAVAFAVTYGLKELVVSLALLYAFLLVAASTEGRWREGPAALWSAILLMASGELLAAMYWAVSSFDFPDSLRQFQARAWTEGPVLVILLSFITFWVAAGMHFPLNLRHLADMQVKIFFGMFQQNFFSMVLRLVTQVTTEYTASVDPLDVGLF